MPENIIASVPVGLVVIVGILLCLVGLGVGWLIASRRSQQMSIHIEPGQSPTRDERSQRLARNLAHELRTPLTAIMGHVEIMNSCGYEEETLWRRSLGFVSSETERLARLVEDMLYLSRLENAPFDPQPVNLRREAEEAVSILYDQAEKSKVSLVLRAAPDLPRVQGDPDRLRQVFINLLDNAIKYAPGSTVTINLFAEEDRVVVRIADGGNGISADDAAHVFEPFYRSDATAGRERGTGLGLTIVQAILVQHRAPIEVDSTPGRGTSFTFSLGVLSG